MCDSKQNVMRVEKVSNYFYWFVGRLNGMISHLIIIRWLLGLKTDEMAAQKTFRMLNAIIENKGDLLEEGKPTVAEKAWLRLSAGCAMLKICEQKGVGDQFTTEQFYNLSKLVNDPVAQVGIVAFCPLF